MIRATSTAVLTALLLIAQPAARAQEAAAPAPQPEPEHEPEPAPEPAEIPAFNTNIYGFIDTQFHELAFAAGFANNDIARQEEHEENDTYAVNLNLMLQGQVFQRYHWFLNFGAVNAADISEGDTPIGVRNAWIEIPLYRDKLVIRAGKTYRRFGLYNEILDAAPTFPGVEAPEFLVRGQFLLTRTTNLMLHGTWLFGESRLMYTLHTGSDERAFSEVPLGGDLRYAVGDQVLIGTSGYWTGGDARPTRVVGTGQPEGGVADWMAVDRFVVFGSYLQFRKDALLVQLEYWRAQHQAERNPSETLKLNAAPLNQRQRDRYFNGATMPTIADVNVSANYVVQTAWSRIAYDIPVGEMGMFTPYFHFDWYSNPETVEGAALGGNEAGLSDDGQFFRTALGFAYRPVPPVALKAELNPHFQKVAGDWTVISPFQVSISYYWKLEVGE